MVTALLRSIRNIDQNYTVQVNLCIVFLVKLPGKFSQGELYLKENDKPTLGIIWMY